MVAGTINELPLVTGGAAVDIASGVIAFVDPDAGDRPTASVISQTVVYHDAQGNVVALSPQQTTDFENAFLIVPEAGNTNSGKVDWGYTLADKALDFLGVNENITVTSTIQIDDGHGGKVTQDVAMTINGADDLPLAAPDVAVVQKGKTVTVDVAHGALANDHDPDASDKNTLYVSRVNGLDFNVGQAISGTYGTLTLKAGGGYTYTETRNFPQSQTVTDSFAYTVDDGHGGTSTSTLTLVVQGQAAINKGVPPPTGGSLVNDLAIVASEIANQVSNGDPIKDPSLYHLEYHTDSSLIRQIAADVAAQFNSYNYTFNAQGYINASGANTNPTINQSYDQCTALVAGLDEKIGFPTANWTNELGGTQIVLNNLPNPAIPEGTAIPIATFDANHHYDTTNPHAGIFLGYGNEGGVAGFFMLDQYVKEPHPEPAEVRFYPLASPQFPLASEYWSISIAPSDCSQLGASLSGVGNSAVSQLVQAIATFGVPTGAGNSVITNLASPPIDGSPFIASPSHHG